MLQYEIKKQKRVKYREIMTLSIMMYDVVSTFKIVSDIIHTLTNKYTARLPHVFYPW